MTKLDNPIRYPDAGSSEVMTKRGWWLVLLGFFIPGAPQVLAGSRKLGRFGLGATLTLWAGIVVAVITYLVWPQAIYALFTQRIAITVVQVFLLFYAVLWLVLTLNTLRLVRIVKVKPRSRAFVAGTAVLALLLTSGSTAYAAYLLNVQRGLLGIFTQAERAEPIDGRYNILLLGADAGEDREGVRPDSITIVSVDAETGQAVMVGVPRDVRNIPIPEASPLMQVFTDGLDEGKVNGLYSSGMLNAGIYPDAAASGSNAGIEATKDGLEGLTGITIQYYVMVDMAGFAHMIDALGGVTITVESRVAMAGHGATGNIQYIEPGVQKLDGGTALWYARSRFDTTDWDRMVRQRNLQVAILEQFTPANVLSKYQGIADAGSQIITTDIPESMLAYFVDLATKTKKLEPIRVDLGPDVIDQDNPDTAYLHEHLHSVLYPPVAEESEAPAGG
ncbi:hypothetical protein GCM10022198_10170 [Klugiella xanthotipulae]|uniref:LytR family transcriptional attenuator n=1 Tax=Klugiella xanthotipulae TaxID=244735 RepID=A0A543HYT5_9MICO|nr:LCP family protein [Klugiella xanthotipulae]TQM63415.1 LytR family transcriptional attenuator [Klugiella xanthotipulae]